jgi:dipeptidyl aminopeptidase/acylaminoacyl peptidase
MLIRKCLLPVVIISLVAAPGPVRGSETPHPFHFNDMIAMKRLGDPQISPDGQWVCFALRTYSMEENRGRTDLWLVSSDGAHLKQLTTHEASDYHGRWSPDGKTIAFISTRGGSAQIWMIPLSGGEARRVTDFPVDVDGVTWSPDGRHIAFTAEVYPDARDFAETAARDRAKAEDPVKARVYTELLFRHWDTWEDGKRSHIFVMPAGGGKAVDIMRGADADTPTRPFGDSSEFAWAPEGGQICFTAKMVDNPAWSTDYDLYTAAADGSGFTCITPENKAWDTTPVYSPDGAFIAYLAMMRPGYEADRFRIVLYDRRQKSHRVLTENWDRSPGGLAWSPDSKTLYATATDLGGTSVFSIDAATGEVRKLVPAHHNYSVQAASDFLVFLQSSFVSPAELFRCDTGGGGLTQLTRVNQDILDRVIFSPPERFSFKGAEDETVYGWFFKPVGFEAGRSYPLAFLIHGGPQGSWRDRFHYRWNAEIYAGAGYAVAAIDFHGSTGYGQRFTDSINRDWGGKPYVDLMKGLDYLLETRPYINPDRLGALGASFGGYMVNWIQGQTDRFRCLVNHDGGFDEVSGYYNTEELWFPEWDFGGTPYENPELYEKWSPRNYVKNWKTPTLVIHGALDFRVVEVEGFSTFTALRRKGIPAKLLYFPDENHWVLKPKNSAFWHETVLGWLDEWLKTE